MPVNVYIAFQNTNAPANTNKTWNSTTSLFTGVLFADLLDEAGNATGWGFECTAGPSGNSNSGVNAVGSGDAAWVDEAIISDEFHFESEATPAVYEISGLDDAKTYDIELFASWAAVGSRRTQISADNFATSDEVQSSNNSTDTAQLVGISPASGIITLGIRKNSLDQHGHYNALWIQENDAAAGSSLLLKMMQMNQFNGGSL